MTLSCGEGPRKTGGRCSHSSAHGLPNASPLLQLQDVIFQKSGVGGTLPPLREASFNSILIFIDFNYCNAIDRLNWELRRRTCVVGISLDSNSALMLACTKLSHMSGTQCSNKEIHENRGLRAYIGNHSIAS